MTMKRYVWVAAVLVLAACEGFMEVDTRPAPLTFADVRPVMVDVQKIEFVNSYRPPAGAIEHVFPTPPVVAAERLAKTALAPTGGEGVLRVIVNEASVVEEKLPVTKGVVGVFKQEPEKRLVASLKVRFEQASSAAPDIVQAHADIVSSRSTTLMKGISIADRDRSYDDLTKAMMSDLENGLKTTVAATFGKK